MYLTKYLRIREEVLTTSFISLEKSRAKEAWKIRILKQDYCGLLTFKKGEPTKCTYCLVHNPYRCCFKITAQQLLFERLFR